VEVGIFSNQEIGPLDGKFYIYIYFSYLLAKIKGGKELSSG
jgi:hypothetical protein